MSLMMDRRVPRLGLLGFAALMTTCTAAAAQNVTLVDMVPNALSAETARDAEPNLAVNGNIPTQIVGSAFTPDPMASSNLPLFVSTDGGATWTLSTPAFIPGTSGACVSVVCDITIRFGGSSNILYVSDLNPIGGTSTLDVWQVLNPTSAAPTITSLETRAPSGGGFVDQPYIEAATQAWSSQDVVLVAANDLTAPGGKTAAADHTLSPVPPAPAGFSTAILEPRATTGQDAPSVRTASYADGTTYAIYYGFRPAGYEVVVARDSDWGASATPFQALIDPDASAGKKVVSSLSMPSSLGNQRVGWQDAIAVDPQDPLSVYIAYAEGASSATYTLHVRHSGDGGTTWDPDIKTVTPATNPGVAVSTAGEIGFLYQKLVAGKWETHLERSKTAGVSWTDILLASVPDSKGSYGGSNPIGDYTGLLAVGKDFYGIFSGFNTPDTANFYPGVSFPRNHDFVAHTLLDLSMNPVAGSIDPFFFHVSDFTAGQDFYVRDWSDSPTVHDNGQEPSTNPYFMVDSDVWNRRSNTNGGFDVVTDRPNHEDPQDPIDGNNFAFVRIHRNAVGSAAPVTARFLIADFGLGTTYQDADPAPAPVLNFAAGDTVQTQPDGVGYQWALSPGHSTHICMGVEISAAGPPADNYTGDLWGHAAGWPTTDMMIINDNNKAQRNMGVYTAPHTDQTDALTYYATIHNAATRTRDMVLRYTITEAVARRLKVSSIEVQGGGSNAATRETNLRIEAPKNGATITLKAMQPGENRWLGITMSTVGAPQGALLPVAIREMNGNSALNGILIGARDATLGASMKDALAFHAAVFRRMDALFKTPGAAEEAKVAASLQRREPGTEVYIDFLRKAQAMLGRQIESLTYMAGASGDAFGSEAAAKRLQEALDKGSPESLVVAHMALLEKLDTFESMIDKAKGDTADILPNFYWQRTLYLRAGNLKSVGPQMAVRTAAVIRALESRKARLPDYGRIIADMQSAFADTAKLLHDEVLDRAFAQMQADRGDAQKLQGAHRQFLLRLSALVK